MSLVNKTHCDKFDSSFTAELFLFINKFTGRDRNDDDRRCNNSLLFVTETSVGI